MSVRRYRRPRPLPTPDGIQEVARQIFRIEDATNELRRQVNELLDIGPADAIERWARSLTETNCSWHYYDLGQEILSVLSLRTRAAQQPEPDSDQEV